MQILLQKILINNVFHLLDKILLLLKINLLLLLFLNIMNNYMMLNLSILYLYILFLMVMYQPMQFMQILIQS